MIELEFSTKIWSSLAGRVLIFKFLSSLISIFRKPVIIIHKRYRGEVCRKSDLVTTYTEYGKCYTFNKPRDFSQLKMTLKGGIDNGLELVLNLMQDDYMPVIREQEGINAQSGFKVHIHDPSEPNFVKVSLQTSHFKITVCSRI